MSANDREARQADSMFSELGEGSSRPRANLPDPATRFAGERYWETVSQVQRERQAVASELRADEERRQRRLETHNARRGLARQIEEEANEHDNVEARFRALEAEPFSKELHERILDEADRAYKSDRATISSLTVALYASKASHKRQKKAAGLFERIAIPSSAERTFHHALQSTRNTPNAYLMAKAIRRNKDLQPQLDLLTIEFLGPHEKSDPGYEMRGKELLPRPGSEIARRIALLNEDYARDRTYPNDVRRRKLEQLNRILDGESASVNERANSERYLTHRSRNSESGVPLPTIEESVHDTTLENDQTLPRYSQVVESTDASMWSALRDQTAPAEEGRASPSRQEGDHQSLGATRPRVVQR
jgi:hypothetical protein